MAEAEATADPGWLLPGPRIPKAAVALGLFTFRLDGVERRAHHLGFRRRHPALHRSGAATGRAQTSAVAWARS